MSKTDILLSMLLELPPQLDKIEKELQKGAYTSEEVTCAACQFVDDYCWLEYRYFEYYHARKPKTEEIHSSYLYEICALLLRYGLNPNLTVDDTNLLSLVRRVDSPFVAAKTSRLLLENGADFNLYVDGESVFENLDFDIVFDAIELEDRNLYMQMFWTWLLMIGYGATMGNGQCPVEVADGFSVEQFKDFENFTYEIEFLKKDWIMHIIDSRTNERVAKLA